MSDAQTPELRLKVLGAQDAEKIQEQNTYWSYYWMVNAKGVKVPVPLIYAQDALKRGYIHTDRQVYTDDPEDNTRVKNPQEIEVDPTVAMAKAVEKLAQTQETTVEILEKVTQVKKRSEKVKNTLAEEAEVSA